MVGVYYTSSSSTIVEPKVKEHIRTGNTSPVDGSQRGHQQGVADVLPSQVLRYILPTDHERVTRSCSSSSRLGGCARHSLQCVGAFVKLLIQSNTTLFYGNTDKN